MVWGYTARRGWQDLSGLQEAAKVALEGQPPRETQSHWTEQVGGQPVTPFTVLSTLAYQED